MNAVIRRFVDSSITEAVGWSLLHFLWQGLLVGAVAWCLLDITKRSAPRVRYAIGCAALLVMAVLPCATFLWFIQTMPAPIGVASAQSRVTTPADSEPNPAAATLAPASVVTDPVDHQSYEPGSERSRFAESAAPSSGLRQAGTVWLPWVVVLWGAGVLLLALRLIAGLRRVHRWRAHASEDVPTSLVTAFDGLCRRMKIRVQVRLLTSARASVPGVIGWFKPVVLVPVSMVSGLTASELESILAHELAHVRRHDYLVNVLQSLAETVLFYHPVVWWVSRRVRIEREHCCDDIAIEAGGDRVAFASALARMEEIRCGSRHLVAASGGSLVGRIRRILAGGDGQSGTRCPAGLVTLASMGLLAGILCVSLQPSSGMAAEGDDEPAAEQTELVSDEPSADHAIRKSEVRRRDSKTGVEKRVFENIRLSARPLVVRSRTVGVGDAKHASVEMMYSNVMRYTFIPARVAKALGATELGKIDFGEKAPPPGPRPFQTVYVPGVDAPRKRPMPRAKSTPKQLHVHEVSAPVGDQKIVPYGNDAIWVPGHLEFYGMNKTKQRVFSVVRLSEVDLGVGPKFGPVNALVLNDENSDFGVLGRNWAARPRGANGEGLWFSADGTFHFQTGPKPKEPAAKSQSGGTVSVSNSGREPVPARIDRPGVKILATHTYNLRRRASTSVINVKGTGIPVDRGVKYDGKTVYATLFYDIVAVGPDGKVMWHLPWGKQTPTWHTVSVVELDRKQGKTIAVELFAANRKTRELTYRYHDLQSGEQIEFEPPQPAAAAHGQPVVHVDRREGGFITRAVARALLSGASAPELLERFRSVIEKQGRPVGSTISQETIVSATPHYLLGEAMDADEITLRLPPGSGLRAEFSAERIDVRIDGDATTVTLTQGRIELIDAEGVVRANATADGGAEQLVARCRRSQGEVVIGVRTQRLKKDEDYPNPPVQMRLNRRSKSDEAEEQPHGTTRYELDQQVAPSGPMRMKMVRRFQLERLARDAAAARGYSWEKILWPDGKPGTGDAQPATKEDDIGSQAEWGPRAKSGDLRLRLTTLDAEPRVGGKLRLKLELKNFGTKAQSYDAQHYAAFRVLRVTNAGGQSDRFVGMVRQTAGGQVPLAPGESVTLWESEDAAELYMLNAGEYRMWVAAPRSGGNALPASNEVRIRVRPGKQTPLKRFLTELIRIAPAPWKVSNGFGAAYLSHEPTNLKRDATTIQVWFTEQKPDHTDANAKAVGKQVRTWLGQYEAGHLSIAAPPRTVNLWENHVADIRAAAERAIPRRAEPARPWSAFGQVTDKDGKPLPGVSVRAHTGMGTLRRTGTATTDANGRYEMNFGPGFWSKDKTLVQAATISVSLEGHFEKNLHRQGDLIAALKKPEKEIRWGDRTADDLFLPGQPREINFVMVPAVTVRGFVVDAQGKRSEGIRVSLTGDELPPSSSVVAAVKTNAKGEYEFRNIPTGFAFQVLVEPKKAQSPWLAWASAPVTFLPGDGDSVRIRYSLDSKPVDFRTARLDLFLDGAGLNWKRALRDAKKQTLKLSWDGLSTPETVRARSASITLDGVD